MSKVEVSKETAAKIANLRTVEKNVADIHTTAQDGMKKGDTKAARIAISAENDLSNLKRIIKRYESGDYK